MFTELAAAGALASVSARGIPGGYVLVVRTEAGERLLETQRGQTRIFTKLDTVAVFVRSAGLHRFDVDLSDWSQTGLL